MGPGAWWSIYQEPPDYSITQESEGRGYPPATKSWTKAGNLYEHLLHWGLARVLKSHVSEPPRPGDLIFFDEKGTALTASTMTHVEIVVATEPGKGIIYVEQHSPSVKKSFGHVIKEVDETRGDRRHEVGISDSPADSHSR